MSNGQKSPRRDLLTSTTEDGKIELAEEQMSRVSGGSVDLKWFIPSRPMKYESP
jgi:hypothetical protein